MNLQNLSLAKLFSRRKSPRTGRLERVEETHIPATSFGEVPTQARKHEAAENILAETSQAACQRSGAGMTAFVP